MFEISQCMMKFMRQARFVVRHQLHRQGEWHETESSISVVESQSSELVSTTQKYREHRELGNMGR
jgi:hypothetical protein